MLIAVDIETGAQPDEELLRQYEPPEKPGAFDPASVDLGRAKKQETIDAKIAEAEAIHCAKIANWPNYLASHKAEWLAGVKEKAALDPLTGRVLAIGMWDGFSVREPHLLHGHGEVGVLTHWWETAVISHVDGEEFVFHNGVGFDLPFLVRRSWLLDVSIPDWVFTFRGGRLQFNSEAFLDTMTTWTMGAYGQYVKLDVLARAFGVEGKLKGCTGADFDRMYHGSKKERELALEYLRQDVRVTLWVAQRLGMG